MTAVPTLTLNNGVTIPQLGIGVFQVPPEQTRDVVLTALEVGYRHVDTAQMYGNERGVGEALAASGLDRSEVFVTSKLNNNRHDPQRALEAFDATLDALGTDHVDLFLVHWPLPTVSDYTATWGAMEEIYASGRARAVGVSNFQPAHLDRLAASSSLVPAVNQVEVHPYFVQDEVRWYDEAHGIVTEAWSPIAQGKVLDDAVVLRIAEAIGATPAQVVLAWHLGRGDVVFPKTTHRERMGENLASVDVVLSEQQSAAITALDRGMRIGPDPDTFAWMPKE
jgi:2,5-diketo-D-gluconate reductase A